MWNKQYNDCATIYIMTSKKDNGSINASKVCEAAPIYANVTPVMRRFGEMRELQEDDLDVDKASSYDDLFADPESYYDTSEYKAYVAREIRKTRQIAEADPANNFITFEQLLQNGQRLFDKLAVDSKNDSL